MKTEFLLLKQNLEFSCSENNNSLGQHCAKESKQSLQMRGRKMLIAKAQNYRGSIALKHTLLGGIRETLRRGKWKEIKMPYPAMKLNAKFP